MNKFITIYFLFAWSSVFAQRTTLPNTATQSPSNKNLYNANGQVITGRLVVNDSCWFNGDQSLFDGNVGIGTTIPNAKLSIYDVGGPGGATTFYWSNTSNSGDTIFTSYTGGISQNMEVFDSAGTQRGLISLLSPFATLSGKAELQFELNGNTYFTGEGNVGIGTVSPDFNLHVAGSFFAEKTVGGRTVHMVIDTFAGFTQILYEFTSGDTSNVMGITPGDAFMRANTDGTDYDVIMNISDPGGVKIQGKSTTTGNALTILEGDSTIFAGDTLYRFGNNGTMQVYGMAGSAQKIVTADATGVLDTAINLLAFNIDGDGNMYAGTDALAALTSGALNFAAGINAGAIIEDGAGNTIIGNEATVQSANTSAAVSIGYQANAGENAISIGYTSQAQALASIALGEYSAISPGHTYSIALGLNATTTEAKQFFITDSILHTSFKGELVCRDKTINTTAGDAATINAIAGRFRKDNSGATFTLTDSYITANSIIQITPANAVIDATATTWTVSAGVGSATITFNLAPTANFDMNFFIIN